MSPMGGERRRTVMRKHSVNACQRVSTLSTHVRAMAEYWRDVWCFWCHALRRHDDETGIWRCTTCRGVADTCVARALTLHSKKHDVLTRASERRIFNLSRRGEPSERSPFPAYPHLLAALSGGAARCFPSRLGVTALSTG